MPRTLTSEQAAELGRKSGAARRHAAEQRKISESIEILATRAAEGRPPLTDEHRLRLLAILGAAR